MVMIARPHRTEAAFWRLHEAAKSFIADLESAAPDGVDDAAVLNLCSRYIAIVTAHIDPLREALDEIEASASLAELVDHALAIGEPRQ